MNDGPAETGTPEQSGGMMPPTASVPSPRDGAAVVPTPYPTPPVAANSRVLPSIDRQQAPFGAQSIPATPVGVPVAAPRDPLADVVESVQAWFRPRAELRAADIRRNLPLGVAIAALNGFADALLLPVVIVAALVARVSDSNQLVALIPVVAALSWALPGAIAGSAIANRMQTVALAVIGAGARAFAMGLLALVGAGRADGTARQLLTAFFILYAIVGCTSGFATLAGQRLPGRIATNGVRGRLVRWQALATVIATVLAALLARRILVHGPIFPRQYLYLFFVSFIALVGVVLLTAALTERAARVPTVPRPALAALRAAPDLLRLTAYRNYLIFRSIALVATLAEPFYVVYALRSFHVTSDMIGTYAIAVIGTRAVTIYLWRTVARIGGTKLLLQLAALCRALAAVIAIGLPVLFETVPIADHFASDLSRARSFIVVFVCIGAAMGANAVAQSGFLLDILPPNAFADGVALTSGVLAAVSVALIAGGIIVDRYGFRALFIAALVLGLATVLTGGMLREPRRPLRRSGGLGPGIRRTEAFSAIPRTTDSFPTVPPYRR